MNIPTTSITGVNLPFYNENSPYNFAKTDVMSIFGGQSSSQLNNAGNSANNEKNLSNIIIELLKILLPLLAKPKAQPEQAAPETNEVKNNNSAKKFSNPSNNGYTRVKDVNGVGSQWVKRENSNNKKTNASSDNRKQVYDITTLTGDGAKKMSFKDASPTASESELKKINVYRTSNSDGSYVEEIINLEPKDGKPNKIITKCDAKGNIISTKTFYNN